MNWKEFKDEIEKQGITDDMLIDFIEVSCISPSKLQVHIDDRMNEETEWNEVSITCEGLIYEHIRSKKNPKGII